MLANGARPGTYWTSGVFTTYGAANHPYMLMSEHASMIGAYYVMVDITNGSLVWALPALSGEQSVRRRFPRGWRGAGDR